MFNYRSFKISVVTAVHPFWYFRHCCISPFNIVVHDLYRIPQQHLISIIKIYISVSQPPGRGPVPSPGINYTGLREVLLEVVILIF